MKAPQVIYIIIAALQLFWYAAYHGRPKSGKYDIFDAIIAIGLLTGLLLWGGWFSN